MRSLLRLPARFPTLSGLVLLFAFIATGATLHARHVDRVCKGVRNVAACDLSLQAFDDARRARAAGNGESL